MKAEWSATGELFLVREPHVANQPCTSNREARRFDSCHCLSVYSRYRQDDIIPISGSTSPNDRADYRGLSTFPHTGQNRYLFSLLCYADSRGSMSKQIHLVPSEDRCGFECSVCGARFVPIPFRPDELLQKSFQNHVENSHSEE